MRLILLTIAAILSLPAFSQEVYNIKNIPDSLQKGADAVIRADLQKIDILSSKKISTTYKHAITILNERAKENGSFKAVYDKFSSISNFKGTLYDASGKKIKKIKESDLTDMSLITENNLYQDDRIKFYDLNYPNYPYTIEYEWTTTEYRLFILPSWSAFDQYDVAIENSQLEINYSPVIDIKVKCKNLKDSIATQTLPDKKQISYAVKNLQAMHKEEFTKNLRELTPLIEITTSTINYDDFIGSQSNWSEFGMSIYNLWKNRDNISPILFAKFNALKGKPTIEIAEAVRSYLKENTRYVNVSLGIGGYQPLKAEDVEKRGYGDCKALTNFAYALFKAAEVKSCPVLVNTFSDKKIDNAFTKAQFNHVFLCIPNGKDSLWLECTNPTYNVGYIPSEDTNKQLLLFNENGGKIVTHYNFTDNQNMQSRVVSFDLNDKGDINGTINQISFYEQSELTHALSSIGADDQRKYILKSLSFSTPVLSNIKFENYQTPDLKYGFSYNIKASNYASTIGKRIFVPAIPMEKVALLPKNDNRKYEYKKVYGYYDNDTISFKIPAGYKLEGIPAPKKIATKFGEYSMSVKQINGELIVVRTIKINKGIFPAKEYAEAYEFYKAMNMQDNSKIILVKDAI